MKNLYALFVSLLVLCLPLKSWAENSLPAAETNLSCETALNAVLGTNTVAATQGAQWFRFTMPEEGKLSISTEEYTDISVYGNTCGNLQYLKNSNYTLSVVELSAGDEVYIQMTTYSPVDYNWNLAVSEYSAGDLCSLAVTAAEGTNPVPATVGEYWYRYTMPRNGKINITSSQNEYLALHTGDCENLLYKDYGYGSVSAAGLLAGDEVFVSWNVKNGGDFSWDLSVVDNGDGDLCATAITAVEGANSIPAGLGDFWTSFTMPKAGKLKITSENGGIFSIYKNSCESPDFLKEGYNSVSVVGLEAGELVFLKWTDNRSEGFSWSLMVEDYSEGDLCSRAITAVEGENNVLGGNGEFWYRFTIPKAGKLIIDSGVSGRVILYKNNSCAELYNATYGYQKVSKAGMEEGDEVLIYWESNFSPSGFSWNLSMAENGEGDLCKLATVAAEGENVAPEHTGEYWYRFIMPKEGNLVVSSEQDVNVEVFAQSCDNLYPKGNGYKNLSLSGIQSGEEVLIKIMIYGGTSFSWNLAIKDYAEGDLCSLAVTAVEGANSVPLSYGKYWLRYIMPKEGKLSVSTDKFEFIRFYTNTCENLNYIKGGYQNASLTGLAAGEQVYVSWDNHYGGNFSWNLAVEDYTEGDICSMAIAVAEGEHFIPDANGDYWYRFVMPKDGKLKISSQSGNKVTVYSNNCDQLHFQKTAFGEISVAGLLSGEEVYILQSKDSGGSFTWNIKAEENGTGDICSHAGDAANGDNFIPENGMDYWSVFTMPVDGKLIIAPDAYRYFQVYKNSCEIYQDQGSEKLIIPNLALGEKIFIKWFTQDSQTSGYNLAVEEPLAGEDCSIPAVAVSGNNTVPAVVSVQFWYSYTIPQDGKLIISSETNFGVEVFGNSCELTY